MNSALLELEIAETEFHFVETCRDFERWFDALKLENDWRESWHLLRVERNENPQRTSVDEDRELFSKFVVALACRELGIEEPRFVDFFSSPTSLHGFVIRPFPAIALEASRDVECLAITAAHECRHLDQHARGERYDPIVSERDAVSWSEAFFARRHEEIRNAARLLNQR